MTVATRVKRFGEARGIKAIGVSLLVLVMFVPMLFVSGLIEERQERAREARGEVGNAWGGGTQTMAGPFLVVPYDRRVSVREDDTVTERIEHYFAIFLPDDLTIEGNVETELRYRGIFDVSVYTGDFEIAGRFEAPDMTPFIQASDTILWDQAFVTLNVTDTRGIRNVLKLDWSGATVDFLPGPGVGIYGMTGIHAPLDSTTGQTANSFRFDLRLAGSEGLRFVPLGRDTRIAISSTWPHPSFEGGFLPSERNVTTQGFSAEWQIPSLARSFPQSWKVNSAVMQQSYYEVSESEPHHAATAAMREAAFGVDLRPAVDFYQKVARSAKYAILFFAFTFLAFFLYETLLPARVHVVQYLMVGLSQCIFYLLLLSLAEQIGFLWAYMVAAAANIGLITIYASSVLKHKRFAAVIFAVLLTIYALLFSLLQSQDYALLFGSIAAFVALAATMFLTRSVNWYGEEEPEPAAA